MSDSSSYRLTFKNSMHTSMNGMYVSLLDALLANFTLG